MMVGVSYDAQVLESDSVGFPAATEALILIILKTSWSVDPRLVTGSVVLVEGGTRFNLVSTVLYLRLSKSARVAGTPPQVLLPAYPFSKTQRRPVLAHCGEAWNLLMLQASHTSLG
jgi:hypothetical protein